MSRRLVICCDGTWDTEDQKGEGRSPTNVTRVFKDVARSDGQGVEQTTYYHPGVGTSRGQKFRGGAFGYGLSRDVKDAYRFIVSHFEPGDELFFFGFSRGAFTARSTAGLVRNAGILKREEIGRVDEAYDLYRNRLAHPRSKEAQRFRDAYSWETSIRFIGVWDTVGALGIPLSGLRWVNVVNRRWQFHDTDLSTTVGSAFQAIAVDERRQSFKPTIWKQQADAPASQQLQQVWFAGVHCDVGGGYARRELADITLWWMKDRAVSCGLVFDHVDAGIDSTWVTGPLHHSDKGAWRVLKPYVRPIGEVDPKHEYAASTAVERLDVKDYSPANLGTFLKQTGQAMIATIATKS
jgi:uncharacterized protein (DUF2235 family)